MTTLHDRIDAAFAAVHAEVHASANRHHRGIGQAFRQARVRLLLRDGTASAFACRLSLVRAEIEGLLP